MQNLKVGDMIQVQWPRTQWAKNRVREHGNIFRVRQTRNMLRPDAILLECQSCGWIGWFHNEATFGLTLMVPLTLCRSLTND